MASRRNAIVAGTGFQNDDGTSRKNYIRRFCREGVPVFLERDPNNRHDPNAIAVYIEANMFFVFKRRVQIGYIKAEAAARLAKAMDDGISVESKVESFWAPADIEHPRVSLSISY